MKSETSTKAEKRISKRQEVIYPFICKNITLINSSFSAINEDELTEEAPRKSAYAMSMGSEIGKECFSVTLHVRILIQSESAEGIFSGHLLEFAINGLFINAADSTTELINEFIRLYSLSILWPYAREYASDILKRAAVTPFQLPIINPQFVMEDILSKENYQLTINR